MASGNKIKELIKKKNISVAELSRKTKISAQTLYSTINRDSNMSIETLQKIATALNVSIYELTVLEREEMEKNNLLFIIDTYGTKMQEDIAIEELAELQKAILKHRRYGSKETEQNIIDEIADVEIMLEQLKIIYSCQKDVENRIEYKIEREIKRIKKKYNIAD